jgi:hypothetical protein
MTSRLKEHASISDQIKLLARLSKLIDNDPRPSVDVITSHCNFSSDQLRRFMAEYRRTGDDPLEV